METPPKTHLRVHGHWLIFHPDIKEVDGVFGASLAQEAEGLPKDFLLAPVLLSPDRLIYFHGGDFLPLTHMPMPWADNQPLIGQYPKIREVGFIPLHCFLIPDHLYKKLKPPAYFGDNIIEHADFVMRAKELGAKCFVTPNLQVVYPHAYKPVIGRKEFIKTIPQELKSLRRNGRPNLILSIVFRLWSKQLSLGQAGIVFMLLICFGLCLSKKSRCITILSVGRMKTKERPSVLLWTISRLNMDQIGFLKLPFATGQIISKTRGLIKLLFQQPRLTGYLTIGVQCFNEMDEVWVTSEFSKRAFVNSGVKVPVFVIGEGVDPNYFHPGILPYPNPPKEKFRFLSNFAWGRRKGVDVLFEAFRKEFSEGEDVCLMLKVLPSYAGHNIKDELKLLYERNGSAPGLSLRY
jgi:hypothetical protein